MNNNSKVIFNTFLAWIPIMGLLYLALGCYDKNFEYAKGMDSKYWAIFHALSPFVIPLLYMLHEAIKGHS